MSLELHQSIIPAGKALVAACRRLWYTLVPAAHSETGTSLSPKVQQPDIATKSQKYSTFIISPVKIHEKNVRNVRFDLLLMKRINLESLEIRRLRADLLLVYRIIFALIHINTTVTFTLRN